jgi:hypothetical protein
VLFRSAYFIIHPNCEFLKKEFPNNKYFIVFQTRLERLYKDCEYLSKINKEVNKPDLYYSYGIPIYYEFGKINWFHISNILPLNSKDMGLSLFDRNIRIRLLRWKIIKNYNNADIISAESLNSLSMIKNLNTKEMFLSINGSDDEIIFLQNKLLLVLGSALRFSLLEGRLPTYQQEKQNVKPSTGSSSFFRKPRVRKTGGLD